MTALRSLPILAAALPAFLLTACGGGDAPSGGSAPAASAPAAPAAPSEIRVQLAPIPEYRAEGTVRLVRQGESLMVESVVETHLNQGDYPMHIHEGTCAEGGRVVVPLTSVQGQESGEGTARTTFPASQLSPTGSYFVQIHAQTGEPVACVNLPPINL